MVMQNEPPGTVGAVIEWCADALDRAGVYCGHGTDDTIDESASLVFHVAGLVHPAPDDADRHGVYAATLAPEQFRRVRELLQARIERRIPMPYLLKESWFAGLKFFVDERVLIPRSPFAELVHAGFHPWLGAAPVRRILEIGTGSGCIAIACALAFPEAEVIATDISPGALEVARINVADHRLERRVRLLQADLFANLPGDDSPGDGISGSFDLIVSNPPYVPEAEVASLPPEYHHEPIVALASGADGLSSVRRILQDAAGYLAEDGLLAIEVGAGRADLEAAFPSLPFIWPEFEFGGEGIALLGGQALKSAHPVRQKF